LSFLLAEVVAAHTRIRAWASNWHGQS